MFADDICVFVQVYVGCKVYYCRCASGLCL